MKDIGILAVEWGITSLLVWAGLSDKQVLFVNGSRTAVITWGTIGFAMCMVMPTIGIFIKNAPSHPLNHGGICFWCSCIANHGSADRQMEYPYD